MRWLQVLGTEQLFAYLDKYDIELSAAFDGLLDKYVGPPLGYRWAHPTKKCKLYLLGAVCDLADAHGPPGRKFFSC